MADGEILGFGLVWPRIRILVIFQSAAHSGRQILFSKGANDLISTQCVCEVRGREGEASRNQEGCADGEILEAGFENAVCGE